MNYTATSTDFRGMGYSSYYRARRTPKHASCWRPQRATWAIPLCWRGGTLNQQSFRRGAVHSRHVRIIHTVHCRANVITHPSKNSSSSFLPDYIIRNVFQIHSFVLISICVANNGHLIDIIMLNLLRMSILIQRHNYPRAQSLWSHVKSKMAAPTDRKFNGKHNHFSIA